MLSAAAVAGLGGTAAAQPVCQPAPPPALSDPSRHAPPAALPVGTRVALPFAPPVGETLRYRIRTTTSDGARPRLSEALFTLRFARRGGDWLMTLVQRVPDERRAAMAPAALALIEGPMTFRLNRGGRIVGMENEAAYWAARAQALRPRGGADPLQAAAVDGAESLVRNLPDAQRFARLAGFAAPVLSLAGVSAAAGVPLGTTRPVHGMAGVMSTAATFTIDRLADGHAILSIAAEPAAAGLETMFSAASGRLGMPGPQMRVLSASQREEAEVSLATGLARRYFAQLEVEVELGGRCSRLRSAQDVERIDAPAAAQAARR